MKRFLKHTGVILIGIIFLSQLLSGFSLWSLRRSSFYKPSYLINGVKDDSFDYIILGASTGLTTLDTKVIDSITHFKGLNLSMDDTSMSSHYLMLEHFLAEGKTTSYCILAPSDYNYSSINQGLSDNDYRFIMYANRDYVKAYYADFKGLPAQLLEHSRWLPMLGVAYYNTEVFFPSLIAAFQPERHNRFDAFGNYTYPVLASADEALSYKTSLNLEFKNPYIEKIKTLCDAHGITLICYLSPIKDQQVKVITDAYNVINHSDLLTNNRFFYDEMHVNTDGRLLCSENFGREFKMNFLK